jgi:hypothetical protein
VPVQATSLWLHNGSTVELANDGDLRQFYYYDPKTSLARTGVAAGTLLFDGRSTGNSYIGTAYFFNPRCGRGSYEVSGPILDSQTRVVLEGRAPKVDNDCHVTGYFTDRLDFKFVRRINGTAVVRSSVQAEAPPVHAPEQVEQVPTAGNAGAVFQGDEGFHYYECVIKSPPHDADPTYKIAISVRWIDPNQIDWQGLSIEHHTVQGKIYRRTIQYEFWKGKSWDGSRSGGGSFLWEGTSLPKSLFMRTLYMGGRFPTYTEELFRNSERVMYIESACHELADD